MQKDAKARQHEDSEQGAAPGLTGYDGVTHDGSTWQACLDVPGRGLMVVGKDPHQLVAAWLRDEAARLNRLHFIRNIPKDISLSEVGTFTVQSRLTHCSKQLLTRMSWHSCDL